MHPRPPNPNEPGNHPQPYPGPYPPPPGPYPAQYPPPVGQVEQPRRAPVSRLVLALHIAAIALALLAFTAMFLPWQVRTNSKVNLSGSNTAGVTKWGLLTIGNIPYVAAAVAIVALIVLFKRTAGPLHLVAGLVYVIGGLWIGAVTAIDVFRMPNDTVVHSVAGVGVYLAEGAAVGMVIVGALIAVIAATSK